MTINERFGAVYLPLDGVLFKTKDDTDGRFYTSENLKDVEFVPDEGCEAAVWLGRLKVCSPRLLNCLLKRGL